MSDKRVEKQPNTLKLVEMSVLIAISIILVYLIRFPIFPAVPFLEYEPGDIPILIGGMVFGPLVGIILTIIVSIIQGLTVSSAAGVYGIIMHIIATSSLVFVSSLIYKKRRTKKGAVIALISGTITMVVVMFFANLIVTPHFMGIPVDAVMSLMGFILLFNLIKAGINSVIAFIVYKRVSKYLKN